MLYLAFISPLLARLRRMDKGLLALLVLLVVTAPVISKRIYASDEVKYLAYTQSLVFDQDLDFGNQYQGWYDRNPQKYVPNIFEAKKEDFITATHRVLRSPDMPSSVTFPMLAP